MMTTFTSLPADSQSLALVLRAESLKEAIIDQFWVHPESFDFVASFVGRRPLFNLISGLNDPDSAFVAAVLGVIRLWREEKNLRPRSLF
jgi:hypothetical protein